MHLTKKTDKCWSWLSKSSHDYEDFTWRSLHLCYGCYSIVRPSGLCVTIITFKPTPTWRELIILWKNMFGCPLKFILKFFGIFGIYGIKQKYSDTIMYECEKSSLTHELSYIGLFNFSHLSLFHVNVMCKK